MKQRLPQRLADENAALRAEKAALETRLFAADAAAFRGRKNALVFRATPFPDSLRRLCTALMEQCTGVCAAFFRARMPEAQVCVGQRRRADVHALCKRDERRAWRQGRRPGNAAGVGGLHPRGY